MLKYLLLPLLLLVSACSNLTAPNSVNVLRNYRQPYHQSITMSGRLSALYEQNNRPQTVHINFTWSQTRDQIDIALISPTGQTLATMAINADGAELKQPNKPPRFANDTNELMLQTLGWPLPVAGLRDWLQGYLDSTHHTPITSTHPDTYFVVDGWTISYPTWEVENDSERPKRIDLKRQTEQAGLVSLRIAIDEWIAQ